MRKKILTVFQYTTCIFPIYSPFFFKLSLRIKRRKKEKKQIFFVVILPLLRCQGWFYIYIQIIWKWLSLEKVWIRWNFSLRVGLYNAVISLLSHKMRFIIFKTKKYHLRGTTSLAPNSLESLLCCCTHTFFLKVTRVQ